MLKNVRIGQLLVDDGYITDEQVASALAEQKKMPGKRLGEVLVELGYVSETQLLEALQRQMHVDIIDLETYPVSIEAVRLIPEAFAQKHNVLPVRMEGGALTVATNDPLNFQLFEEMSLLSQHQVLPVLAYKQAIAQAIAKYYAQYSVDAALEDVNRQFDLAALEEMRGDDYVEMMGRVENSPVVKLVNKIIAQAYRMRASDIHIEPSEENVKVRMRVDGDLIEVMLLNPVVHVSLVTRVKIMAGMDIAERRVPQDGRFSMDIEDKELNIRASTLPTVYGEKIVIRLLGDNTVSTMKIAELGMNPHNYALFTRLMKSPNGVILVTGPTGSGKTTTVYAMLSELNTPSVNLISIEDPVEKIIRGVNQVQINDKAGLSFASCLRSVLRQDPDIVMVGEIRDGETAEIASRAAITGHLVLTTVHTNDAASTFMRLVDMGVEPYMVASAIKGVVAQRLVKLICPYCKREYIPDAFELDFWEGEKPEHFYTGDGCAHCNYTGYMGRTSIHEIIIVNPPLRELILEHATSQAIKDAAHKEGTWFLKDSLMELVREGRTTMKELIRTTYQME